MPAINIAYEVAQYLEEKEEGSLGTDLFVDSLPDQPDNCVVVYDFGGNSDTEPPESLRELTIQVRSLGHSDGYQKIWSIMSHILYPDDDFFQVGYNLYHAELKGIPTVFDRDSSDRFLYAFQLVVQRVNSDDSTDTWLEALASWSEAVLGATWTVYRSWTGNKRPSVTWRVTGVDLSDRGRGTYLLTKRITGQVKGKGPNQQMSASLLLAEKLCIAVKLLLNEQSKSYLTVKNPSAGQTKNDSLTMGQISLSLSKVVSRTFEGGPLMAKVFFKGEVE